MSERLRILFHQPDLGVSISGQAGPGGDCRDSVFIDSPYIFFVDDALALNRNAAKKLFTEMIPLRRLWLGQGTVSLSEDVELLKLMKRSGCMGLLIGFESVQKATQNEVRKNKETQDRFL